MEQGIDVLATREREAGHDDVQVVDQLAWQHLIEPLVVLKNIGILLVESDQQ